MHEYLKQTPQVVLMQSKSAQYLLSKIRSVETQTAEFRFFANRLMRLLLEEAIVN
jgi:uracil phosphoribosyltransferase